MLLLAHSLYQHNTTQQREDVKLLQMAELLKATHAEIEAETILSSSRPDYVILGDFNSTEVVTNHHCVSRYTTCATIKQESCNLFLN